MLDEQEGYFDSCLHDYTLGYYFASDSHFLEMNLATKLKRKEMDKKELAEMMRDCASTWRQPAAGLIVSLD